MFRMANRKHNQKAFSLIEAAIVLGIVGLVLGGIWVAAASVSSRNRVNDAVTGTAMLFDKARKMFANVDFNTYTDSTDSDFLIASKLVPPNWINGTTVVGPFDNLTFWADNYGGMEVSYWMHSSKECFDFVTRISQALKNDIIMINIANYSASNTTTTMPMTITDAPECDTSAQPDTWIGVDVVVKH